MTKKFLTDKDVEELFQSGVKSLQVDDDVVLTDLAFEKARMLGLLLKSDSPPAAPVRPYLSEAKAAQAKREVDSVSSVVPRVQPTLTPNPSPSRERGIDLEKRIRERVAEKLGNQVDASLLDTIIKRTMKVIRLK